MKLPPFEDDPLATLAGSAVFEPADIDETVYEAFAFDGDFAAAGFSELRA